jgi:hypothetical protein
VINFCAAETLVGCAATVDPVITCMHNLLGVSECRELSTYARISQN